MAKAPLTSYTRKELLQLLNLTKYKFNIFISSIKGLGKPTGNTYDVKQVEKIFNKTGTPDLPEQKKK